MDKSKPSLLNIDHHPGQSDIPEGFDLGAAQLGLLHCQQAVYCQKQRVVIVFEGTDTAGKGGTIRRLVRHMDPRGFRVYPIGPPDVVEQGQHYLQRFWNRLPQPGEVAIFDRSWYGRVLVERVEQLTDEKNWSRGYEEIRQFEKMLVDDGIILIKFLLHIDEQEQRKRLLQRLQRPEKRWKVTEADLLSYQLWTEYRDAMEDLLRETSLPDAPWHVVAANSKPYARYRCLEQVAKTLKKRVDVDRVQMIDVELEARAQLLLKQDKGA